MPTKEQLRKRREMVRKAIEEYQFAVNPNYKPTKNEIEEFVNNENNFKNFEYLQECFENQEKLNQVTMELKAVSSDSPRSVFSRFVPLLLKYPKVNTKPTRAEMVEIKRHNNQVKDSLQPGEAGDNNERNYLLGFVKKMEDYEIDFSCEDLNSFAQKNLVKDYDILKIFYNLPSLKARLDNYNITLPPERWKVIDDKYDILEVMIRRMNTMVDLSTSPTAHYLPNINIFDTPMDDATDYMSKIEMQKMDQNSAYMKYKEEKKKQVDHLVELYRELPAYRSTKAEAERSYKLGKALSEYYGKNGFQGECYDKEGNPVKMEVMIKGTLDHDITFMVAHPETAKDKDQQNLLVVTVKDGEITTSSGKIIDFPKVGQYREALKNNAELKNNQQPAAGNVPPVPGGENGDKGNKAADSQGEGNKAEEPKAEAGGPEENKPEEIQPEGDKPENNKQEAGRQEEAEAKNSDPTAYQQEPEFTKAMYDQRLRKRNSAVEKLNGYLEAVGHEKISIESQPSFEEAKKIHTRITHAAAAKKAMEASNNMGFLPSLQGMNCNVLSFAVPEEIKKASAKEVVSFLVDLADKTDIKWFMEAQDDDEIAKGFGPQYAGLKTLSKANDLLTAADTLGLQISPNTRNAILMKQELIAKKFEVAANSITLMTDENYQDLPDLTEHDITVETAQAVMGKAIELEGSDGSMVKTMMLYAVREKSYLEDLESVELREKLYETGRAMDLTANGAKLYSTSDEKLKVELSLEDAMTALGQEGSLTYVVPGSENRHRIVKDTNDGSFQIQEIKPKEAAAEGEHALPADGEQPKQDPQKSEENKAEEKAPKVNAPVVQAPVYDYTEDLKAIGGNTEAKLSMDEPEFNENIQKNNNEKIRRASEKLNDYLENAGLEKLEIKEVTDPEAAKSLNARIIHTNRHANQIGADGVKPLGSLQGYDSQILSGIVPESLQNAPTEKVVSFLVDAAANTDIGWLMKVNSEDELAKGFGPRYQSLRTLYNAGNILSDANRLGIEIPEEKRSTIRMKQEIMSEKFAVCEKQMALMAEPNYFYMPALNSVSKEDAKKMQEQMVSDNSNDPFVKTLNIFQEFKHIQEADKAVISFKEALYATGHALDMTAPGTELYLTGSQFREGRKTDLEEALEQLRLGKPVGIRGTDEKQGVILKYDADEGSVGVTEATREQVINGIPPVREKSEEKAEDKTNIEEKAANAKADSGIGGIETKEKTGDNAGKENQAENAGSNNAKEKAEVKANIGVGGYDFSAELKELEDEMYKQLVKSNSKSKSDSVNQEGIKLSRADITNTLAEFNTCASSNAIKLTNSQIDNLIGDKQRSTTILNAKNVMEYIGETNGKPLPNLRNTTCQTLSFYVPEKLGKEPTSKIVSFLVEAAAKTDISWLMKTGSDDELAEEFGPRYGSLKVLANADKILQSAQNLGIEIPKEKETQILTNFHLIKPKFAYAESRMALLADDNYMKMPKLEDYGITAEQAWKIMDNAAQKNPGGSFVNTMALYANYLQNKAHNLESILVRDALYQTTEMADAVADGAEFYILGDKKTGDRKVNTEAALNALGSGKRIASFAPGKRDGFIMSYEKENNKAHVADAKIYKTLQNVKATAEELEEEKEIRKAEKFNKQYLKAAENSEKLIDNYVKALQKVSGTEGKIRKIQQNKKQYVISREEYQNYKTAKQNNQFIANYQNSAYAGVKNENDEYEVTEIRFGDPTCMVVPQFFEHTNPDEEGPVSQAKEMNNMEIANAFMPNKKAKEELEKYLSEQQKKLGRVSPLKGKDKDKATKDFYQDLLYSGKLGDYVANPEVAKKAVGGLFRNILQELDPKWFAEADDREIANTYSSKWPYVNALQNVPLRQYIQSFHVDVTPNEMERFEMLLSVLPEPMGSVSERFEDMLNIHVPEARKLDVKNAELDYMDEGDFGKSEYDKLSQGAISNAHLKDGKYPALENHKKLMAHLESMECYQPYDKNNKDISNGKKFYSPSLKPLSYHDAVVRIAQGALQPPNAGQPEQNAGLVYIVDHKKKECLKQTFQNGAYKSEPVNYQEMELKLGLADAKRTSFNDDEKIAEKDLSARQNVIVLKRLYDKLSKTNFKPFVTVTEPYKNMYESLDKLIKVYENLRPVPLESDQQKLSGQLEDFKTKVNAYITYKENRHGITGKEFPDGYFSYLEKRDEPNTPKLTWREESRLDATHKLKLLTELQLIPNSRNCVVENGIYNQQQRLIHFNDNIPPKHKQTVREFFDKTLASLREEREQKLDAHVRTANNMGVGYSAEVIDENDVELQAYKDADELLTLAYDFEGSEKKPVYRQEVKDKIYEKLTAFIVGMAINQDVSQPKTNKNDSGYDMAHYLTIDVPIMSAGEAIRMLLPEKDLNPMNIIGLVANRDRITQIYKERTGDDIRFQLRDQQVSRNAVNRKSKEITKHPEDPTFKPTQKNTNRVNTMTLENFLNK